MKARVLQLQLARLQCSILHLRRERMRDGIAENAEADLEIDMTGDILPVLKIMERVDFFRANLFHVIPNECEGARIANRSHN